MLESSEKLTVFSRGGRVAAVVAVVSLVVGAGCRSWIDQHLAIFPVEKPVERPAEKPAEKAELESVLADGNAWSESIRRREDDAHGGSNGRPRWRNQMLEDFLSRPNPDHNLLRRALAGSDNVAAANAAIALARLGDCSGEKRLAASVRSVRLKLPLRLAAAEALGTLQSPSAADALRELVAQYGDFRLDRKSQYIPQLHVELLLGLAKRVSPQREPRLLDALDSPDANVRLTAVGVWSRQTPGKPPSNGPPPNKSLPDAVADLTADSDPRVRGEALAAVARRRHPRAKDRLEVGLRDGDIHVRIAAIGAIGEWADPSARQMLLPFLQDRSSMIRAATVEAMSGLGAEADVLAAATDKAWRVRAAAARSLSGIHGPRAINAARRLLIDASLEVQEQLVIAVADWPLSVGGPILLAAMDGNSPRTRKLAAERLASRWPPAAHFPFAATKKRRDEVMLNLRQEFSEREQFAEKANIEKPSPAGVDADVLSTCDPAFELIAKLHSDDVFVRRHASTKLAAQAAEKPLGRAAVERLVSIVVRETDQLVWQNALIAVSRDDGEAAVRLAYAAVGHDSAEVRRRACEHLSAHPGPQHAAVLLPAIDDPSVPVAKAAVDALGRAGPLADTGPLKKLLLTGGAPLRLEVAVALLRLGDSAGDTALRRLAHDDAPQIRRDVAQAMGRSGKAGFIPVLIGFLDDRAGVRREALKGLALLAQDNPVQGRKSTAQQVELWKQWYEK